MPSGFRKMIASDARGSRITFDRLQLREKCYTPQWVRGGSDACVPVHACYPEAVWLLIVTIVVGRL
jgi:hypothetical protein